MIDEKNNIRNSNPSEKAVKKNKKKLKAVVVVLVFLHKLKKTVRENVYQNRISPNDYPDVLSYASSINMPLCTPEKWRRELAFTERQNGETYRISIRHAKFEGRCSSCKNNTKSAGVCFLNLSRKDEDETRNMQRTLDMWNHELVGRKRHADEFEAGQVKTIPDYDIMRTSTTQNRIPTQHMLPPLQIILMSSPFYDIISPNVIIDFLKKRAEAKIKINKVQQVVLEDKKTYDERMEMMKSVYGIFDTKNLSTRGYDRTRSYLILNFYDYTRAKLAQQNCGKESCSRKKNENCVTCCAVKSAFRKYTFHGYEEAVNEHLKSKFEQRMEPFANVPKDVLSLGDAYINDEVRVERVRTKDDIEGMKKKKKQVKTCFT